MEKQLNRNTIERDLFNWNDKNNDNPGYQSRSGVIAAPGGSESAGLKRHIRPIEPGRRIVRGDRIYVRVMQEGATLLEIMVDNASSLTDLIGEIRYAGRDLEGLTKVFIRNHSRGWSCERPLKFYTGMPCPRRRADRALMREAARSYNIYVESIKKGEQYL